jgi:hypothetical protein
MDPLKDKHEQIVDKIGDCGDLSLALISSLPSQGDGLQSLFRDKLGLLLVRKALD